MNESNELRSDKAFWVAIIASIFGIAMVIAAARGHPAGELANWIFKWVGMVVVGLGVFVVIMIFGRDDATDETVVIDPIFLDKLEEAEGIELTELSNYARLENILRDFRGRTYSFRIQNRLDRLENKLR